MCSVAKIERFREQWPDSDYGPAHILIVDKNIEDDHIDWCIKICGAVLSHSSEGLPPKEIKMLNDVNWWADHEREEVEATLAFLREYRMIPEDARVEPGDRLCRSWKD